MTTLVVLAAGMATRYGADKQLEGVGPSGETLMDYAVFDAWRSGCRRVVFVVREALLPAFERQVLPRWSGRLETALAVQRLEGRVPAPPTRLKPWGTAHALLTAAPMVPGDALVCNADDFYGASAVRALLGFLERERKTHGVAGYPLAETLSRHGGVSRALCRTDPEGRLLQVEECTGIAQSGTSILDDRARALAPDALVSMNLWALHAPFLKALDPAFRSFAARHGQDPTAEFRIPDVVNDRIAQRKDAVQVIRVQEHWFGMTYAADRAAARTALARLISNGAYPRDLFAPRAGES